MTMGLRLTGAQFEGKSLALTLLPDAPIKEVWTT